jgi:hypothetical protein
MEVAPMDGLANTDGDKSTTWSSSETQLEQQLLPTGGITEIIKLLSVEAIEGSLSSMVSQEHSVKLCKLALLLVHTATLFLEQRVEQLAQEPESQLEVMVELPLAWLEMLLTV